MKVCTDSCLFGALVPAGMNKVLDIGTGTGLLSLMLAQKDPLAKIDAVEIDEAAAEQAKNNFASSPWADRLNIFNADILNFETGPPDSVIEKYDCIISNPPFFEDDLRSSEQKKNIAKHDTSLSLTELIKIAEALLTKDGSFALLLPYHRVNYFIEEATRSGMHLTRQILVRQTAGHDLFRGILFFRRMKSHLENTEIIIKDHDGKYTAEFTAALKDYYLYL